jgi:hypothetical protein
MISSIHLLGFLMEVQEGCIGQREARSLLCSLGEFERSIEERMEAMVEGSLGASFHGGLMEA